MSPSVLESAIRPMNSKNCVARTIVYGTAPALTSFLLRDLRAQVAALGEPVGADDRQRDVVPHAGGRLRREQVAGCGLEEVEHGRVVPRGCVRHVDDDLGALECFGEPLARERVDSRVRRRRERLVTGLPQLLDELRPNEAGSADDNDLHLVPFACVCMTHPPHTRKVVET